MTYIDRDLGPEGPTRAPAKPVTTQRTPSGGQPPLLDLQRLAGNAAVSSAIQGGRFDSSVPVQRIQADEDEETETEGYANDEEEADEAEEQAEAAEEAKDYGESDEAAGPQGYANDEEEADEAEEEADAAEEAKAYGESETDESEEEAKEE